MKVLSIDQKITDLKLNKIFALEYDSYDMEDIDFMPFHYSIERVKGEMVKVIPADDLNDEIFLLEDIEEYPLLHMVWMSELLCATISIIKAHSEMEPVFEFETKKNYFKYTLFLSGKTVEEIINKLSLIYKEVAQNVPDYAELRKQIFNN